MRSTRTSIGIILTLSLLALPLGATGQSSDEASADKNEATEPVYVTWSGTFAESFSVRGETPWGERGYLGMHSNQTSEDPRISGEHTVVMFGDGPGPWRADEFSRFTSLVRIENDEGAWQGPLTEVFLPDQLWVQYGWLKGEGAYEGLSFFTSGQFDAGSATHMGQGMIWPGDPPPVPDPALLAAGLDS